MRPGYARTIPQTCGVKRLSQTHVWEWPEGVLDRGFASYIHRTIEQYFVLSRLLRNIVGVSLHVGGLYCVHHCPTSGQDVVTEVQIAPQSEEEYEAQGG